MSDKPKDVEPEDDDEFDEFDEGEPGVEGAKLVEDGNEIGPVAWIAADEDEGEFLDDQEAGDGAEK